jgi:two-component system sensor histidine kinase CpxA
VIEVAVTRKAKAATITIGDYGPGVAAEALPQIFEPFFRAAVDRDAEGGGLGLGLSIAKRAVKLHHGEIPAQNPDPGLRVQIVIPLIQGIRCNASA